MFHVKRIDTCFHFTLWETGEAFTKIKFTNKAKLRKVVRSVIIGELPVNSLLTI